MGDAAAREALRRLAEVVSPHALSLGFNPARLVSNWNESEGRTFAEVDAAFAEAIRRVDAEIAARDGEGDGMTAYRTREPRRGCLGSR